MQSPPPLSRSALPWSAVRATIIAVAATLLLGGACRIGFDTNAAAVVAPDSELDALSDRPPVTPPNRVDAAPDAAPNNISSLLRVAPSEVEVGGDVRNLLISGQTMFATSTRNAGQIIVYDISSGTPVQIGQAATAGFARKLALDGQRLYVTSDTGGDDLEIFDVSNPATPVKLGGIATADSANGLAIRNGRAYVTSNAIGDDLEIFDVSNPAVPAKLGGINLINAEYVNAVAFKGDQLYVAGQRFAAFDVSNPAAPVSLSDFGFFWYAQDLKIVGNRAYALEDNNNNSEQLRIFDLSNPLAPVQIGAGRLFDSYARELQIIGRYAVTVCAPHTFGGGEIEVFDVSGTGLPPRIANAAIGADGLAVALQGSRAYVGLANNNGPEILVFDLLP